MNTIPYFMKLFAKYQVRSFAEALGTDANGYTDQIYKTLRLYERGLLTVNEAMYLLNNLEWINHDQED